MKSIQSVLILGFCFLMISCGKDDDQNMVQTQFTGPMVSIGNGQAWSYVRTDFNGDPLEIGVKFTEDALVNLPSGSAHGDEFLLPLPSEIEVPPYDHITLDWNEHGHEPLMVYDLPHFDVHFYFMSETERNLIGPNDESQFNKPLPASYLPPMYLETPGGVPRMGAHIIDLLSPEIAGTGIFTHTFIYGKYDGRMNFLEPMVTKATLDAKVSVDQEIRHPSEWQQSGYYPHRYNIYFDNEKKEYSILLTELHKF